MIGKWLETLTLEQEDRVLGTKMAPYWRGKPKAAPRCVVVTAWGGDCAEIGAEIAVKPHMEPPTHSYRWKKIGHIYAVPAQYDALCRRFGADRVNAALRSRILRNRLRNRLRRTLASSVNRETVEVA